MIKNEIYEKRIKELEKLIIYKDREIKNLTILLRKANKEIEKIRKHKVKKNKISNTKMYKDFRKDILRRDNYQCKQCGSTTDLEVHHIKSRKLFPNLIMDTNNVITLCRQCHSKTDSYLNNQKDGKEKK